MALESWLVREGFRVSTAFNGVEALDCHGRDPADVLVTDLRMPRLDGRGLIARLRETDPDLPVLVLTGYRSAERTGDLEGAAKGPIKVLSKPASPTEIVEILRAFLAL